MVKIPLTNGKFTLVDDEDFERVKDFGWCVHAREYVGARVNGKMVLLHRLIMNAPKEMKVDHINHDTFDNRKSNLRICTQSNNMWNALPRGSNTGIRGVHLRKKVGNYQVDITTHGKRLYLGVYDTLEEAKKVRYEAEEKYHGEYRVNRDLMPEPVNS